MLSVPKQQSHKRKLPTVFEGNKPSEQQGATTTFKNWAAKVQIYMSLEDHNLASILEDVKTQKYSIVDSNYIDYYLHEQGLGLTLHIQCRYYDAEKARRRANGDDGVPADEAVPALPELPENFKSFTDEQQQKIDDFTEAFNHYSRALQYTLTKVTKQEPYRFVVQGNHNNSSGFEAWRR
eukprot:4482949-Amphidinium_carterae.1